MEHRLIHLSELTQKWLVYAEAKNTALIVGNMFALFKVINTIDDPLTIPLLFHLGIVCLAIATILAFAAVFPLTKYLNNPTTSLSDCSLNPFSSKNLLQHSPNSLLKQLDISKHTHHELEFAEYLIGTAKLIIRKYTYFRYGSIFTVLGVVILALVKLLA